ncbi:MAG: Ig-like domain-containing protein, partial [Gemmatimonadaceae bacterium]
MRSLYRPIATVVLAVGVATCSDSPTGPVRQSPSPSNGIGREAVAFAPVFSKAASATAARLLDLSISYDRVRIVLVRPVADTVKDTTIVFTPGSADVTLDLNVDVRSPTEVFNGSIDYANATGVVFHGEGKVQAHPANQPAPTPQPIVVDYVGPGSHVARIVVSPNPVTILATETMMFTASAQDANGASIAVPLIWSVSDPSIASISQSGLFVPAGKRGTVNVIATTPTNVSDNALVTVALPPAGISLVSGGGQTGKVGAALGSPAVVRVVAADGLGVPGVSVNFGAPTGGSIGAPSVVTDAAGNASTSLQLGTAAGPQSFVASTGAFSVAIPEVATAGNATAIAVASGSGQSDIVRHALKAPLVVRVSDALSNPVPGVAVNWAKTAGGGTLGAATSTTGADGLASVGYTLGSTAGTETVAASVAGITATASFTLTAAPALPSGVSVVSGADQTGTAGAALASPIVVKVIDASGNPVADALVSWSSSGGTVAAGATPTGADGLASNTFTLGTVAGVFTVTASVGTTASVTMNATGVAGTPASLVWKVQPTTTAAGSALAPALRVAIVDANGNVASSTNTISLTLAGGTQGAQLTGTKTKSAVAGVATFDDLKLDLVGSGYTFVATGAGITPTASSSAFAVVAGSAQSAMQLLLVPATSAITLTAGVAPTTLVALKTADVNGVAVANVPVTITFARSSAPTIILGQSTSPSDANGLVKDVTAILGSPATAAGTYIITAKSSAIPNVTVSLTVTVQPAVASKLAIVTQPADAATSGVTLSRQPIVQVQDAFGNATSAGALQVTATPSAGTTSGNVVTAGATTGTATFSTLSLTGFGNVTLTFTASGATPALTAVVSAPVSITAGAPVQLHIVAPTTMIAGTASTVLVQVQDAA